MSKWIFLSIVMAINVFVLVPAWGDEQPAPDAATVDNSAQPSDADVSSKWQIFFAAANVYPGLEESESKIDKMINGGLGVLFYNWNEPTTFKDWGEEGRLWDFQVGIARRLNEKWSCYAATGGTLGLIENGNNYWTWLAPIPMKVETDFERKLWFLTTGLDYYFMGRPELPERREGEMGLVRCLRGAKPYAEMATGYINLKSRAMVRLKAPVVGQFLGYEDATRYDLFYLSPRLGVDIPVTKRDSVSFAAGYLFFTNHTKEYDNTSIYAIYRHNF